MSYEDTIRVAALKTRGSRFERVKHEVRAGRDQVLAIDEYLHPAVQEIAETLPAAIGRAVERPGWLRRTVERFTRKGRIVTTSSLGGFLMLHAVAGMKRWRRSTTRYAAENAAIEAWLARIAATATSHPALAVEVAQCQRLVKGYSDTHERGVRNFETVMAALQKAGPALAPATLRELREAALADEHGSTPGGDAGAPRPGLSSETEHGAPRHGHFLPRRSRGDPGAGASPIGCIAISTSTPSCSPWSRSTSSPTPGTTSATTRSCPRPATTIRAEIAGQPLIVVRHQDDTVRVLMNRCAHKGSRLVSAPCGHTGKHFRCPYHAWTFRTDGVAAQHPAEERLRRHARCRSASRRRGWRR